MKILVVTYDCKPGMRGTFLTAIQNEGIDQASRSEEGNLRYAYFSSISDNNRLLLLETWKDEDAFERHCGSAHFKKLGEIKNKYVDKTTLEQYYK